jgi:hypothetical protein
MNHHIEVPTPQEVSYFRQLHGGKEASPWVWASIKFSAAGFIWDFGLRNTVERMVLNITSLSVMIDSSRETPLPVFNQWRTSVELPTIVARKIYDITKSWGYVHGKIENTPDWSLQILIDESYADSNQEWLLS